MSNAPMTDEAGQDDEHLGPVTIGGEPVRVDLPAAAYDDPDLAADLAFDATEHLFG